MKYISPADVARIRTLKARSAFFRTAGTLEGRHESALVRGASQEFSQYRQYSKGDETRFLDWKVYARRERLFIREFSRHSAVKFNIMVDASASMSFRGPASAISKWDYAARLAIHLACFLIARGDYAGLTILSDSGCRRCSASNEMSALQGMDLALAAAQPSGRFPKYGALKEEAAVMGRNCVAILISDLMVEPEDLSRALRLFASARIRAFGLQVLDSSEWGLPWEGSAEFVDMETARTVKISPAALRTAYEQEFMAWRKCTAEMMSACGVRNLSIPTDMSVFSSVEKFIRLL